MHIAALDPKYVRREEVTPEMLEKEREIYKAQALATGKPEAVVEKIVTGKMEKFYEENCLYEQHYIKDEGLTIGEMVNARHRQARRKHQHQAFRALQSRRSHRQRRRFGSGSGLPSKLDRTRKIVTKALRISVGALFCCSRIRPMAPEFLRLAVIVRTEFVTIPRISVTAEP